MNNIVFYFIIGTDKYGFGFGGTGKKSNNKQFDSYGEVSITLSILPANQCDQI